MLYYQITIKNGNALSVDPNNPIGGQLVLASPDQQDDRQLWLLQLVPATGSVLMTNRATNQIARAVANQKSAAVVAAPFPADDVIDTSLATWRLSAASMPAVQLGGNADLNLNVQGDTWTPGNKIIVYPWGGTEENERWTFTEIYMPGNTSLIYYQIRIANGNALSVDPGNLEGQLLVEAPDSSDDKQLWALPYVARSHSALIANKATGQIARAMSNNKSAEVAGAAFPADSSFDTNLGTWKPSAARMPAIQLAGNSDLNLNVQGDDWGPGAKIIVYTWSGGEGNERWSFRQPTAQNWNIRLHDVQAAFDAVPDDGVLTKYVADGWVINLLADHIQGMAGYRGEYYLLPKNESIGDSGTLLVMNRSSREVVHKFDTPGDGYTHPDGGQVIGDFLALAAENSSAGFVCFYNLVGMSDQSRPVLLPLRITRSRKAGAVGITDIGSGDQRHYLVAVIDNGSVTFYESNSRALDDPDCQFTERFTRDLPPFPPDTSAKDTQNIGLVTDLNGQPYLIGFSSTSGLLPTPDEDWAGLYKVDLDRQAIVPCSERHMYTKSGFHIPIAGGVSFRWGAGLNVVSPTQLEFFCSARNFIGGLATTLVINEFGA